PTYSEVDSGAPTGTRSTPRKGKETAPEPKDHPEDDRLESPDIQLQEEATRPPESPPSGPASGSGTSAETSGKKSTGRRDMENLKSDLSDYWNTPETGKRTRSGKAGQAGGTQRAAQDSANF